jgi:raffinose/stachyose/melibiose transport system substrate-binding protein
MKKTLTIMLALLLVLALAACGNSSGTQAPAPAADGSSSTGDAPSGDDPAPVGDGTATKVELLTWTNEATVLFLQKIAPGFNEAYPMYTLEISNIPSGDHDQARETRVSAGNLDVASFQTFSLPQVDWNVQYVDKPTWQQYIDDGLLVDLTDQEFMTRYNAEILAGNTYNGRSYSVCEGTVAYTGLFYNKAIFTELNLEVPTTWQEFIDVCEAVKADGKYIIMTSGAAENWPLNMYKNAIFSANYGEASQEISRKLMTGEMRHTDPEMMEIYAMMDQFATYLEPGVTGVNYADAPGRFAAGNMAMYADGSWSAPDILKANPDIDFGYFPLPGKEPREDGLSPQYGIKFDLAFSVPSNAPNQEGALAFLEYFSRKEIYTDFLNSVGGFSSTQPDVTLENEFLNSLAPGLEKPNLNPELLMYGLKGVGEYGANGGFSFFYLNTLGGPFSTQELAEAAAADYDTARAAIEQLAAE